MSIFPLPAAMWKPLSREAASRAATAGKRSPQARKAAPVLMAEEPKAGGDPVRVLKTGC